MEALTELVERSRSGDLDAFGALVRRFQDMAHGYAFSILGDFDLAEDAAQEAFIEAYLKRGNLREAAAFPGWFRRIVFGQCSGIMRRNQLQTVPMEEAGEMVLAKPNPRQAAERRETAALVLAAIRSLPEAQRETTMLFYINGYSQSEIADFLEATVTTVKKRLHDARQNLKERMINMVEKSLKDNALDERFSKKVVAELIARPRPLEIEGHPVREVADLICGALPEYEEITADETILKSDAAIPEDLEDISYHVDNERVLRTQMSEVTIRAMAGRKPPVRLIAPGRTFRPGPEDREHLNVFHQIDVLCIDQGADVEAMKAMVLKILTTVLGPIEVQWKMEKFHWWENCFSAAYTRPDGVCLDLIGCGIIPAESLRAAGFDPDEVSGFGFGMGLERLAMIRLGIDDIRKLWQAPYV